MSSVVLHNTCLTSGLLLFVILLPINPLNPIVSIPNSSPNTQAIEYPLENPSNSIGSFLYFLSTV